MSVRAATLEDMPLLRELYAELAREVPPPAHRRLDLERELREVAEIVEHHVAFVAGDGDGFVLARPRDGVGHVTDVYVRGGVRRRGIAKALLGAAAAALREQGVTHVTLDVGAANAEARAVYDRLGFRVESHTLVAEVDALAERVAAGTGPSHGSVYVQSDDHGAIERAVRGFVPRLGRSEHTEVRAARNGWIEVRDELCSREPSLLRRLARELSDRTGAPVVQLGVEEGAVVRYVMYDRGRVADEYASLPEYHGPLPPGDVVALNANPTVAARLTGADPARVREVARSGPDAGLPPPDVLMSEVRDVLGLPS